MTGNSSGECGLTLVLREVRWITNTAIKFPPDLPAGYLLRSSSLPAAPRPAFSRPPEENPGSQLCLQPQTLNSHRSFLFISRTDVWRWQPSALRDHPKGAPTGEPVSLQRLSVYSRRYRDVSAGLTETCFYHQRTGCFCIQLPWASEAGLQCDGATSKV